MNAEIVKLIHWYQATLDTGSYPLIVGLMAMESSIVPIPSELIIPFAAQHASATGKLSLAGIVVSGMAGTWIGASLVYWACRLAGRSLVLRYGRFFRVPESKVHAAENWAARFGPFGVFVARLLPGVRQIIGIPMGIVKMDYKLYSLYTLIGSGLWCSVLVWVGVAAGNDEQLLRGDLHRITLWLAGALAVLGVLYYFLVRPFMRKPPP